MTAAHVQARNLRFRWLLALLVGLLAGCGVDSLFATGPTYVVQTSTLPAQLIWQFSADAPIITSAAILSGRAVFFATDSDVYAVEPADGHLLWRVTRRHASLLTPVSAPTGDILLVVSRRGGVLEALTTRTGRVQWTVSVPLVANNQDAQLSFLAVEPGYVYLAINLNRGTAVMALRLADGKIIWQAPKEISASSPRGLYLTSQSLVVYIDQLWYLDKDSGAIIDTQPAPDGDIFYAQADTLYVTSRTRGVQAFDLFSRAQHWIFHGGCQGGDYWSDPPQDASWYFVTVFCPFGVLWHRDFLHALDTRRGELLWQTQVNGNFRAVVKFGAYVYLLTNDGSLHALDAETGQEVGVLHVKPATIPLTYAFPHFAVDGNLLVVLYGNQQVFAYIAP